MKYIYSNTLIQHETPALVWTNGDTLSCDLGVSEFPIREKARPGVENTAADQSRSRATAQVTHGRWGREARTNFLL